MIFPNRVTDWVNKDGYCLDCKERLGAPHKPQCVNYKKTVIIEVTIPLLVKIPVSWNKEQIEFHYGESSHCLDNLIDEITELTSRTSNCLCIISRLTENGGVSFVRDATEEDHKTFNVPHLCDTEDLP